MGTWRRRGFVVDSRPREMIPPLRGPGRGGIIWGQAWAPVPMGVVFLAGTGPVPTGGLPDVGKGFVDLLEFGRRLNGPVGMKVLGREAGRLVGDESFQPVP